MIKIKMDKAQKIIWTVYILLFVILYINHAVLTLVKPRIISPEEIKFGWELGPTWYQYLWHKFLYLGWIPALILHFVWRNKSRKNNKK